jgi:LysM repeat protein
MSAMRAEELPELPDWLQCPAAAPSDSAVNRAAALWTAPAPSPTPRPRPPHENENETENETAHENKAARENEAARRSQPARAGIARPRPANPPLRLTRRGRIVVAVAAVLVLSALSLVIASTAQATNHPVPRAAQEGVAQVTVRPGQSLWSVAESADPAADTRVVIQRIIDLNGLTGNTVYAGERLWAPRS